MSKTRMVELDEGQADLIATLLYEEWEKSFEDARWARDEHARRHAQEHVDEARAAYEAVTGRRLPDAPLGE